MNDLKRLVVTHIETGEVVVDVTEDFRHVHIRDRVTEDILRVWMNAQIEDSLSFPDPIGTVKETGGYRFEFRKPEPKPDVEGWIVNDGTMPDCEKVDIKKESGQIECGIGVKNIGWGWLYGRITHYRPAKAETPKPKGVRQVTKTVWLDSDGREYQFEHNAILSELKDKHGFEALHIHTKPDGSSDADAIELFKRLMELRK